ncbi:hypothetical protein HQ865_17330 [Mucilaginibacter mali]|uniref:Uncharacterized protein n=1 Tax=Mucilaginibacter mali TaxID=2740462 RepID=A0A7D4TQL8_9SPHI|nr:hypothetical protein [Mucilaginibacter mali]QKJ31454.1 hypothetical protein HQ865_17330 [Mucilaginibacter mali]
MEDQYTEPEEQPEDIQDEDEQEGAVELYSKWPIRLFSLFFSPIFGGILLMINLRKVGYKQAGTRVLLFSIAYTFATAILLGGMGITGGIIPIVFNLMGGVILSDYYYKKYFPDDDYYPRPVWGALAVALLVYFSIFMAMYYSGTLPPEIIKVLNKK